VAESEAELTEIPASVILDKIQNGKPVEYDHVRVIGDLDVNTLELPTKRIDISVISEECKFVSASIEITNSTFNGSVNFSDIFFEDPINFVNTTFSMVANFGGAIFRVDAFFYEAKFNYVFFDGATFNEGAFFSEDTFSGDVDFNEATFNYAFFSWATFSGYAFFNGDTLKGDVPFSGAKFEGDKLTFRNAVFNKPKSQEEACRRAKNVLAKAGNRDEEEYHFYREMEAKRIQKGIRGNSGLGLGYLLLKTDTWSFWKFSSYDVLEWFFVQKIFGYGVHPIWLFGWWLVFVVVFAGVYLIKGGIEQPDARQWYDYFWFSVATAATPGYALYKPVGTFKFMAGMEAILGTFMWAAFITTFARKFMR
jgi:hypothetical protein